MNTEQIREEYLEEMSHNGEISFNYDSKYYHIEPATDSDDYEVWQFSSFGADDGKLIASCKTHNNVLDDKIFNGKSLMEIDGEITDCYLW